MISCSRQNRRLLLREFLDRSPVRHPPYGTRTEIMTLPSRLRLRKSTWFALLFLCSVSCFGSHGKAAAVPSPTSSALSHAKSPSRFAIADFDGDSRPDLATVEIGQIGPTRARYWIEFQLSTGAQQMIGVNAPVGGLNITSRDVDGDQVLDLIVTTAWLNQPVAVLLNDGHGNFTLASPSAFPAIVWSAEKMFRLAPLDVQDAAVAALSSVSGDCAFNEHTSEAAAAPDLLPSEISPHHAFPLPISVLGRAPPVALHV
jgi:hypothetical protein